jgi:hypothetical protein
MSVSVTPVVNSNEMLKAPSPLQCKKSMQSADAGIRAELKATQERLRELEIMQVGINCGLCTLLALAPLYQRGSDCAIATEQRRQLYCKPRSLIRFALH